MFLGVPWGSLVLHGVSWSSRKFLSVPRRSPQFFKVPPSSLKFAFVVKFVAVPLSPCVFQVLPSSPSSCVPWSSSAFFPFAFKSLVDLGMVVVVLKIILVVSRISWVVFQEPLECHMHGLKPNILSSSSTSAALIIFSYSTSIPNASQVSISNVWHPVFFYIA